MSHLNVEIKAKCQNHAKARQILLQHNAKAKGTDHQVDTYFVVNNGRLKLREGKIENNLIHYDRTNQSGPKQSHVTLFATQPNSELKSILTKAQGILCVVDKKREIYFIENVKFHIDTVQQLGTFVEIEAIDVDGAIGKEKLQEQCQHYMKLLEISDDDLFASSYSDMLIESKTNN